MTAPLRPNGDNKPTVLIRTARWRVFFVSWALLSLLSIAWSLATPIAASPDEPAHLVKAASVARGQLIGEQSPLGQVVQVPRYVASTHKETCFAFKPNVTADCASPLSGSSSEIIDSTTTAGLYNPIYYFLVGLPSLVIGDASGLFAMRAVSGILTSLFLACTVMVAWGWRKNTLPMCAIAIATPPMIYFLCGSVNPNAVEVAATLAVFAAMLAIVLQPSTRLLSTRSAIVLSGAVVAVNARGLSPIWVAIAVFVPLMLTNWATIRGLLRRRPVLVAIAGTTIASAFALVWLLKTNSLAAAFDDNTGLRAYPGVGASPTTGFMTTFRDTFDYAQSMVGNFGWLDTPAPSLTYFIWAVFAGLLLIAGISLLRGRRLLFATFLVAAFLLVPPAIQGAYITGGGMIWQGRYDLPLFSMLAFGLAAVLADQSVVFDEATMSRFCALIWFGWLLGQYGSFATALKRYAVGADGSWKSMVVSPSWNAPAGNLSWLLAFGMLAAVSAWLGWWASRSQPISLTR
jgi:hypothetical protein